SQERKKVLSTIEADAQLGADQRIEIETKWAFDELEKVVAADPSRAWAVILRILKTASQDQGVLDNLAAGPLETLLARHGRHIIERVETEAALNPAFRELLNGVWRNAIDEAVWERIQLLTADSR